MARILHFFNIQTDANKCDWKLFSLNVAEENIETIKLGNY